MDAAILIVSKLSAIATTSVVATVVKSDEPSCGYLSLKQSPDSQACNGEMPQIFPFTQTEENIGHFSVDGWDCKQALPEVIIPLVE